MDLDNAIEVFLRERKYETKSNLCSIMSNFGSDKGNGWHNYTTLYHHLFENKRDIVKNVFEVGLGTNNNRYPSSMSSEFVPCGSLRGWRDYFVNAKIYGADIDRDILVQEDRIQTLYCDQTNPEEISDMWKNISETMDIIIDDGLHEFHANKTFYEGSIQKIDTNGIFIIEDIVASSIAVYKDFFDKEKKDKKIRNFSIVEIPNQRNNFDNVLVLIQR